MSKIIALSLEGIIALIDVDAFFASVEERDHPETRGKPIVVKSQGKGTVVASSNYEAKKYGIESGMPVFIAEGFCPSVIIFDNNMKKYERVSSALIESYSRYGPTTQIGIDEALLDLTQKVEDFYKGRKLILQLKKDVKQKFRLTISVGLSYNSLIAKMASKLEKPDGLSMVVNQYETERIFYPKPIKELYEIGEKRETILKRFNINTIGDFANAPIETALSLDKPRVGEQLYHSLGGKHPTPLFEQN